MPAEPKPTLSALLQGKPIIEVPGYPDSCFPNAYLLPGLVTRHTARLPSLRPLCISVKMGEDVHNHSDQLRFLPIAMQNGKVLSAFKESGALPV